MLHSRLMLVENVSASSFLQPLLFAFSVLSQSASLPPSLPSAGEKWDVVCVDVDNKDHRSGISSPPMEFVSKTFLDNVKAATTENGECRRMNTSTGAHTQCSQFMVRGKTISSVCRVREGV